MSLTYLAMAAAVTSVVSIAASQILMGLALVALIIERRKIVLPPFWPYLAAFAGLTIVSLLASGDPAHGLPQIKKFFVYLMPILLLSALAKPIEIRLVAYGWALGATLSALWSFVQFSRKYQQAQQIHGDLYEVYLGSRITGFMGHWMTFSGVQMIVLLLLASLVFFYAARRARLWLLCAAAVIGISLVLSFTRSVWLGAALGGIYLLWYWRRWAILALPIVVIALAAANPFALRQRMISSFRPRGDMDSNRFRDIARRTGWEMIKAHPWLGVGPEQVGPQFQSYVPADIARPLPPGYYSHLHNTLVHYAAERGVPAALAFLGFLVKILYDFLRGLKAGGNSESRWILRGGIAAVIAILASGFYEVNLGDSEVLATFLAVVACGYASLASAEKQAPRTATSSR
jgi:O-antigen ligase